MSETLAPTSWRRGEAPLNLESRAYFRVRAAGMHGPASPVQTNAEVVVIESDDGIVVFPPSEKLVILAAERQRRAARIEPDAPIPPGPYAA